MPRGGARVNGMEAPLAAEALERVGERTSHLRVPMMLLALVTIPALILDQASKLYLSSHLALYQIVPIIPNWFDITFTLNPGAAFSLFVNLPAWFRGGLLVGLSIAAIIVLLTMISKVRELGMNSIAMALILGGAIGNLIDRLWRGEVVDFIHVHYYSHSYPVFNLADSAISVGVALILIHSLFFEHHE
jgi:signal peptidase II